VQKLRADMLLEEHGRSRDRGGRATGLAAGTRETAFVDGRTKIFIASILSMISVPHDELVAREPSTPTGATDL
jgi:hypothetical protein